MEGKPHTKLINIKFMHLQKEQAELEAAYARGHRHRKAALAFVQGLLGNLHPTARAAVGASRCLQVLCVNGWVPRSADRLTVCMHTHLYAHIGAFLEAQESALLLHPPDAAVVAVDPSEGACAALVSKVARTVAEKCPENRSVV